MKDTVNVQAFRTVEDIALHLKNSTCDHFRVFSFANDQIDSLNERFHDVKGAISRIQSTVSVIESGYRFDDSKRDRMIELLKESLGVLKDEMRLLGQIYPENA